MNFFPTLAIKANGETYFSGYRQRGMNKSLS